MKVPRSIKEVQDDKLLKVRIQNQASLPTYKMDPQGKVSNVILLFFFLVFTSYATAHMGHQLDGELRKNELKQGVKIGGRR